MKKLTLIALFAFVSMMANAQKSSILLSGNVGYSSTSFENDPNGAGTMTEFMFNPMVGFGVSNNIHVGLFNETTLTTHGNDHNGNKVVLGPFVRYSKMFGDVFGVFADTKLGWMSEYNDINSSNGVQTGFQFGILPRALVNINKGFGLTFGFGGVSYQAFGFNNAQVTNFDINFGKQFSVGVQKVFGGKK